MMAITNPGATSAARPSQSLWRLALAAALMLAVTPLSQAADCVKNSEVCIEGPATRDIGGNLVYRDCWRTTSQFSCVSRTSTDDCQPLRDRGCSQVGSTCVDTNAQGACMVYEQSMQCLVATGTFERWPHLCGISRGTFDEPNSVSIDSHIWTSSAQTGVVLPAATDCFQFARADLAGAPETPVRFDTPQLARARNA